MDEAIVIDADRDPLGDNQGPDFQLCALDRGLAEAGAQPG